MCELIWDTVYSLMSSGYRFRCSFATYYLHCSTIELYLGCSGTSLSDIWPCVCSTGSSFPFPDPECVSRSPSEQNISRWRELVRLRSIPCTSDRLWAREVLPRPGDIVRCRTFVRRSPLRWWPSHQQDNEVWTSPTGSIFLRSLRPLQANIKR